MAGGIDKQVGKNGTTYRIRVEYPPDPVTGKRRQRTKNVKTKREAVKELTRWMAEIDRGTALEPDKTTVGDLLDRWLANEAPKKTRPITRVDYEITIRTHLKPALGSVIVQKLTVEQVESFYRDMREKRASSTVKKCHLRLSAALTLAVRWGLTVRNVCTIASPGKLTYKKPTVWDADEQAAFLAQANDDGLHPFWQLALGSGLRRSELLGLRWRDVNWERSSIHVQQEVVAFKGRPVIQEPKTPESRRTVRLTAAVMDELNKHCTEWLKRKLAAAEWANHDLVFCTASGSPINPSHVRRGYDRVVVRAGVPDITIHGMRHTHAVSLLKEGTPVKVVSERLGHKDISTTLNVYAAALPDMQDVAIDALERMEQRAARAS